MAGQVVELVGALLSQDNTQRQAAEKLFSQAKTSDPENLLVGFIAVLADETINSDVRGQAAVLMRQLVGPTNADPSKEFALGKIVHAKRQEIAVALLERFKVADSLQQRIGQVLTKLVETVNSENPVGWLDPSQRGWPQFLPEVFRLADCTANQNPASVTQAIKLIKETIDTYVKEVPSFQEQLGQIVSSAFAHPDLTIKSAAFSLVCEMVSLLEKKTWAPLVATAPILCSVLRALVEAGKEEEFLNALQEYTEVANIEPDFFKNQLSSPEMEPATFLATLVKSKTQEGGVRTIATEWLVTFCEKKPKWIANKVPAFAGLTIECCMDLMLEVEADEASLKEWVNRMDDEEGEEDSDELYHLGESSIDRVVENLTMDASSAALFKLVGHFSQQEAWQAKLAALTAVKQTVEYVESTDHINEMAKLLLAHTDHQHPRVRYTALNAIGQLANDQAPEFQDSWHKTVMPVLLVKMDDPIDRVASMAMSAFVSFGEELESSLMKEYAHAFMEKLVIRLQNSSHRLVQEEAITSIAVIAGVISKDFSQYYDAIMPMLKQLVLTKTGDKENRLRGKAFECMSLLGLAVGKEKFRSDAMEALQAMITTQAQADDLQKEYITEASERICKCLGKDFGTFLPHLLPGIYQSLNLSAEECAVGADDDEYLTLTTGSGKLMKVKSAKFEEMIQSIQLLITYATEMEGAFFDFVPQVAEKLMPLISGTDEVLLLCDAARSSAFQAWAALIKSAQMGAKEKNSPPELANHLLRTFLHRISIHMADDKDPESLKNAAQGLSECFKNVDPGTLTSQEVSNLVPKLFGLIEESYKRTAETDKMKKDGVAGAPQDLQDDEDAEDDDEEEDGCRSALEDAIGSVMQCSPNEFMQCMADATTIMGQWLNQEDRKVLGLFLACDMLKNLKEQSQVAWPAFMDAVFANLTHKKADVRIPAAYAIGLAAAIPQFGETAGVQAFQAMCAIVSRPAPKKRDPQGKFALDNAVSALLQLCRYQLHKCPADCPAWKLILEKLPLKDDEEEAKKVHKSLSEMVLEQNAGMLGCNNCNLPKVLSVLAEIHKNEDLSTKENDEAIVKLFKMLPRDQLLAYASDFTEKQQKKIESILSSA